MTDELLKWRREFPILDQTVYLISHSLGAMPKKTYERLHDYAEVWATRGVRAWAEGWWNMPVTVGDEVARIIGAGERTVVMHQNVSICQSLILSCFDPTPKRNKIVYSELNFPSVMYVYEAHARNGTLRIQTVKSDDGITVPLERMLAAIDEETLLVPFSHVLFMSAFLQDAKAITERAHEPRTTGWMAHESPFAFETDLQYAPDVSRFLHGSPAIPALYAAQSGYEIINQIGVEAIRQKSMRQTARLIDLAEEAGFQVTSPKDPAQRGGTITVGHEQAAGITKELIRREFIVDYRPGAGVRISPHFYTKDEELELVIGEMKKIRDGHTFHATEKVGAAF